MSEPAADHSDIDAGCDQGDRCGVTERVGRDVFVSERGRDLRRGLHVLSQLETHAGSAERLTVAIDEERRIGWAWLSLE